MDHADSHRSGRDIARRNAIEGISLHLFLSALRLHGVEVASRAYVLIDVRRYASRSVVVNGNFVVEQHISIRCSMAS